MASSRWILTGGMSIWRLIRNRLVQEIERGPPVSLIGALLSAVVNRSRSQTRFLFGRNGESPVLILAQLPNPDRPPWLRQTRVGTTPNLVSL